jgi:hypothetical protein
MHAAELVGNPANHWKVPRDWWIVSQLPASMAYDVRDDKRGRFKLRSVAPDNACAAAAFPWRTLTWLMSYCVEPQRKSWRRAASKQSWPSCSPLGNGWQRICST